MSWRDWGLGQEQGQGFLEGAGKDWGVGGAAERRGEVEWPAQGQEISSGCEAVGVCASGCGTDG